MDVGVEEAFAVETGHAKRGPVLIAIAEGGGSEEHGKE